MLPGNIDEIDSEALQGLVTAAVTESITLEFKRQPYGATDKDKKEFLKDVSALANTFGGHLLIGIAEDQGAAAELVPMEKAAADAEIGMLEQILRSGVEPRMIGCRMKAAEAAGGYIIVIYVPKSVTPPHRVILKHSNRFFARNSTGVYEPTVSELKALFDQQRSSEEQCMSFVQQRRLLVEAGDGVYPLDADAFAIIHAIPVPDFVSNRRHDLTTIKNCELSPIESSSYGQRVNLEGVVWGSSMDNGWNSYTQVFRNGAIEAVTTSFFNKNQEYGFLFSSKHLPVRLGSALTGFRNALCHINAELPVILGISFINVEGLKMDTGDMFQRFPQYNKRLLDLPHSLITDLEIATWNAARTEQMNFLWNAFGLDLWSEN